MELLHNIRDILYIILIVSLVTGPFYVILRACREVTGTWNLKRFYLDHRYWAMSVLNFRYRKKKAEGLSGREFVRFFNSYYLAKGFWGMWRKLDDEERRTFVEILSNPRFIEENLGVEIYTLEKHQQVIAAWEELKLRYKAELEELESNTNL